MKILFNGDSITDDYRDRTDPHKLTAYAQYVAEALGAEHEYLQLGIGGRNSAMLLECYEADILQNKPDLAVICIGINDIWHHFTEWEGDKIVETYRKNLTEYMRRLKTDFPACKLIMMEPFLFPEEEKKVWRSLMIRVLDVCREVAIEYADGFIPLDGLMAKEQLKTPWTVLCDPDGVHPVEAGKRAIARYVVAEIKNLIKE